MIRTDIAVLYVGDEAEKQALLLGEPEMFFTTPSYDGLPSSWCGSNASTPHASGRARHRCLADAGRGLTSSSAKRCRGTIASVGWWTTRPRRLSRVGHSSSVAAFRWAPMMIENPMKNVPSRNAIGAASAP